MSQFSQRYSFFIRVVVLLAVGVLGVLGLYLVNKAQPRVPMQDGGYVLTETELDEGVYLLSNFTGEGREELELTLGGDAGCYLLLNSEAIARSMKVNGKPADRLTAGRYVLVILPREEREYFLSMEGVPGRLLMLGSNPVYVGEREQILSRIQRSERYANLFQGAFLFSLLFALSMFLMKKSETYLLFYAIHAALPLLLSRWNEIRAMSQHMPVVGEAVLLLDQTPWISGFLSYTYVFLNLLVHWLVYREFVEDRLGRRPYPVWLLVLYFLAAGLQFLFPGYFSTLLAFNLFYLAGYIVEGIMLLKNPVKEQGETFRLILLSGWGFSFLFWLVRFGNNSGVLSYPFPLGNYVAMGYTISFLLCINGKFAGKFRQADRLLAETKRLNEGLELQVEERTRDLQKALEDVKKAQDTRNQFVANMIHNLKTPLFSLQGYTELLMEEEGGTDPQTREYLKTIAGNVSYVQKLIQQLLLFDRLEEKKIHFEFVDISPEEFLRKVSEAIRPAVQGKNLTLRLKNRLPETRKLIGDEFYLRQALINLLENAVRHSPEGSEILLLLEEKEEKICFVVEDQGEGMTESVQSHIFERGYSHHPKGGKSSGLGLNIVKGIVKAHQGEILVESEPGKGSRFEIRLGL